MFTGSGNWNGPLLFSPFIQKMGLKNFNYFLGHRVDCDKSLAIVTATAAFVLNMPAHRTVLVSATV